MTGLRSPYAAEVCVTYPMGGNWYIINYYVPVLGVTHLLIFARLWRDRAGRVS